MANKITFTQSKVPFNLELKKRVESYFSQNKISTYGNLSLYVKTASLIGIAVFSYYILLFTDAHVAIKIFLALVFGVDLAAIGFNVMHDGAHGSYSKKAWVNEFMAHTLNILGGNAHLWKVKHNVVHHTYTNIEGHDEDIDIKPLIRTCTNQKKRWFHNYQDKYALFLYSLAYFWWVFVRDYLKYFTRRIASKELTGLTLGFHISFWLSKAMNAFLFVILPIYTLGLPTTLVGMALVSMSCGITLSIVFQLAHVVEGIEFPSPNEETHKIEHNWIYHQLATTANFATQNKVVTWLVGGLNFQVEHHLFPKISHIHYPALHLIVKKVCNEYEMPYHEFPSMTSAFVSHMNHLRVVGNHA